MPRSLAVSPSLFAGILAGFFGWSLCSLTGQSLEGRSPFLPPDYKPPTTNTPAPAPDANQELELRGLYELNGEMRFLISDKRTRQGRWVTVNDPDAPYAVRSFDPGNQSVTLERNQRTEVLTLVKPDPNASPIPVLGAPAPYIGPPPMAMPPPMMPPSMAAQPPGGNRPGPSMDPRYMRRTIPPPPAIPPPSGAGGVPNLPPGVTMNPNASPGANSPPPNFTPPAPPAFTPPPAADLYPAASAGNELTVDGEPSAWCPDPSEK